MISHTVEEIEQSLANEWIKIVGFPQYEVSIFGEVRSLRKKGYKYNVLVVGNHGYRYITLYNKRVTRTVTIHRLVAEHFLPAPLVEGLEINHMDGNKLNNSAWNLEWCTRQHNIKHAWATGLIKSVPGDHHGAHWRGNFDDDFHRTKVSLDEVLMVRKDHLFARMDEQELTDKYGVSRIQINHMLGGRRGNRVDIRKHRRESFDDRDIRLTQSGISLEELVSKKLIDC